MPEPHATGREISRDGRLWLGPGARGTEEEAGDGWEGGEAERDRWRPERLGATELEREPPSERRASALVRPKPERHHGSEDALAVAMAALKAPLRSSAAPTPKGAGAVWCCGGARGGTLTPGARLGSSETPGMGEENEERGSGERGRSRELAGGWKEGGEGTSASSIATAIASCMSSLSCSLSHTTRSGMWHVAWASRTVEPMLWRHMGQGKTSSRAFMASWVTRHCMQKVWPHGVVAKPLGPAVGS